VLVMLSLVDDPTARDADRRSTRGLAWMRWSKSMIRRRCGGPSAQRAADRDQQSRLSRPVDRSFDERTAGPLGRGRLVVSESGIANRKDIDRLSGIRRCFLIGSSLMRAPIPAQAARELAVRAGEIVRAQPAEDVAGQAASFAGFVFVPGKPACT
jgi:indole-3-glycerol phosphate synthase / phosphoribosylanthranilate isomerase